MSNYNLIIDIESRRLIADYYSTEAGAPPTIVFGDQPTVNVRLVEPNNNDADIPFKDVSSLTGQTIRVAVGSLEDATPSAYIELTDDLSAASATITEVRAGVLNTTNELQRVQILDAVAGSYTLTIAGETTNPINLDASLETIACELENLASITADSIWVTGDNADFTVEFDSSLADVGPITVNLDNVTNRVGKTGTLNLHTEEILTLLNSLTTVEATLEVVRWTTADVAGETVLQVPVTVMQDVIPDTVPDSTPLPGYATIDLDHINQSGATSGQIPVWNDTSGEWEASTVAGTGDLLSTNNLSDVADAPTALTNLGAASASHTHNLSDINQDAATNGQVITFNSTSGEWEAADSAGGTIVAADITDATADGIALITSADANSFTDAQQTLLGQQSGTNTGDQDLSGYVQTTAIDTLAELNTVVTDATLIDTGDARLSDARTPTAHASSHTDGTDDIQDATNVQKGLMTANQVLTLEAVAISSHTAMTASDSAEIDFTVTGQNITGSIQPASIDETKLDVSVNASLDLADSALQSETNDLSAAVTWANVPDANITQTSVTQHQAALAIDADVNTVSNVGFGDFDADFSDYNQLGNGMALDVAALSVSSDGATVTLSLEKTGTGDIRILFSDGVHVHDCTPAATLGLSAGTDTAPTENFIYVLQSNKTLTTSTSGWPAAEHAPIATAIVQSAASAQTDGGIYKLHAWSDHSRGSDNHGHLAHLNYWIRSQNATWLSGCGITPTAGAGQLDIAVASGELLQLHDHTFPAFNTATGSNVYIINDPTTPYLKKGDLTGLTQDANGDTLGAASSDYYNLVIWGVVSENDADCQLMCNLPAGSYANNNAGVAENDDERTAIYDIPSDYRGAGFLIARLTVSVSGGTYTVEKNTDLRGLFPGTGAGGGATGGSEFSDNVFRIQDDVTATKKIAFQASAITAATTRTITMCDNNLDLRDVTQLGFACSDETTALTTGQKIAIDMPHNMIVRRVYASVATAGTTSAITVDVEDEGTSILNAVLSISATNNNTETSTFASSATSYTLTKGDLLTIDIDSVDSGGTGTGLKVVLVGHIT
mgnify:CR=1 FL=1